MKTPRMTAIAGPLLALATLAPQMSAAHASQVTDNPEARADAYRVAARDLRALDREAFRAKGGTRNACARFEQLVAALSQSLGPNANMLPETLVELRSQFAKIVNRGCPRGTRRNFSINTQTGAIRDSGPPPAIPPRPTAAAAVPVAPPPATSVASPPSPPAPPRVDRSTLIGARADLRIAGERCDSVAYQAAKDRLLALLDTLIADEPDEDRSQALIRERDEVRRLMPPACSQESILDEIDQPPPRPPRGIPSLEEEAYLPVEFWLDLGETERSGTGIGVTRDGPSGSAPETDAGYAADKVRTIGFGGALTTGDVRVRAGYRTGDADTLFDVQPISGGFNGAVFGDLSPASSSGIGSGSAVIDGTTTVDLSQFTLGADYIIARPTPASRIFFTFDYFRDVQRFTLALNGAVSTVHFSQDRDQRIRDNIFAIGIGGEVRFPLGPLRATVEGRVSGFALDTNLTSHEHNVSNFGPTSDRDFTIEIDENDTAFGVRGEMGAKLELPIAPSVSFTVGAGAEYQSTGGGIFNPNSGDQVFFDGMTTAIRRNHSWRYRARLGVRIELR